MGHAVVAKCTYSLPLHNTTLILIGKYFDEPIEYLEPFDYIKLIQYGRMFTAKSYWDILPVADESVR